jgi:hypothetical protein
MKNLSVFVCVLILISGVFGTANAALFDRGGGLIYCDVLDITLLQDAYYARTSQFTWPDAMNWAENFYYYDSVRDVTWSNWRLPSAYNQDGSGPDLGLNVTGSEMGHIYYIELGNTSGDGYNSGFYNSGPFFNVQLPSNNSNSFEYWLETIMPGTMGGSYPGTFSFYRGGQGYDGAECINNVWPVMDGDVIGSVPLPPSLWLFGSGLIGVVGFRKKIKKRE